MADQQQQIPNAPFPAPPPFWKQFTSENLSRLKALKDQGKKPEDIPLELTYLEPPPPPAQTYTIFGEEQTVRTSSLTQFLNYSPNVFSCRQNYQPSPRLVSPNYTPPRPRRNPNLSTILIISYLLSDLSISTSPNSPTFSRKIPLSNNIN